MIEHYVYTKETSNCKIINIGVTWEYRLKTEESLSYSDRLKFHFVRNQEDYFI